MGVMGGRDAPPPPIRLFVGKSKCLSEYFWTLNKSQHSDWLLIIILAFHILLLTILLNRLFYVALSENSQSWSLRNTLMVLCDNTLRENISVSKI